MFTLANTVRFKIQSLRVSSADFTMPFTPPLLKGSANRFSIMRVRFFQLFLEDYLHYIIDLVEVYYRSKLVKWIGYFSATIITLYDLVLLYNTSLKENSKITEEYVFYGVVLFLVAVCVINYITPSFMVSFS